jgi:Pentapeptide repeats (9 copies)
MGAFCLLAFLFLFHDSPLRADANEALHQRILAGDPISFNPSDPEASRTVDAKWVKEATLKPVRVSLTNAVIEGTLEMQDVTIREPFTLADCVMRDRATFSHATFQGDTFLTGTVFHSAAEFQGATFERVVSISGVRFEGAPVAFDNVHALAEFWAVQTEFTPPTSNAVSFIHARFDAVANFEFSDFGGPVYFTAAQFGEEVAFLATKFRGLAEFERADFFDRVDFESDIVSGKKLFATTFLGKASFLEVQFDSSANFDGVAFGGPADFLAAKFHALAGFSGATFKSDCRFSEVRFGSDGLFMGTQFLGPAAFDSSHTAGSLLFNGNAPLLPATFRKDVQFTNAEVENVASFGGGDDSRQGVVFAGKATFDLARFHGFVSFQGAEFKDEASFIDAMFGNDVQFIGASFEGPASFDRVHVVGAALFSPQADSAASASMGSARFFRKVSFSGAHFDSGGRFRKVTFGDEADFGGVHFEGDAHFEECVFHGPTSFRSAAFRVVYFSDAKTAEPQFLNDVDLLGCTYEQIQINWRLLVGYPGAQSHIKPYDRQPYIELEGALRRAGLDEDADAIYKTRRLAERQNLGRLGRALDDVYGIVANYGIDLWRECFWALFFVVIGMFIFSQPGAVLTKFGAEAQIGCWRAFCLAIREFLPFSLPVELPWSPSRRVVLRIVRLRPSVYANFLQIIGWILIPLAAASLAGLLRHVAQ